MKPLYLLLGALLTVALCLPVSGQWGRILWSGKGESSDIPSAHSLSYFTANPYLRDDGNDFCALCTPEDRAKSAERYSIEPMVRPVGVLAGYRIVDVLYDVTKRNESGPSEVAWKSILVNIGPDRYKEIFHLQASGGAPSLKPSSIVTSGRERVLATMDFDGGVGGGCWEGYWWFDRAGPHALDFSPLKVAIEKRIPQNARFSTSCSDLDLKSALVRSGVQKIHPECHACDWVGEVSARFRLSGPIVEPLTIEFKPSEP
jgi:hypothetical protein